MAPEVISGVPRPRRVSRAFDRKNRGPLPEKRVVAETLSQADARLAAMSDP